MTIIPFGSKSPFEHLRRARPDGSQFWSARDLQGALAYTEWRKFEDAIDRAMAAARNSGFEPADHFVGAAKMVAIGSGAERNVSDWHLSRYGAYLVAMNGDPRKPEIAAAQTYFAVKTREAEVAASAPAVPQDYEQALVALLGQVRETKALEGRVAALEPAARAWGVLASGDGDYAVGDAAKILSRDPAIETGRNRLFGILHELDWAYVQNADQRYRAKQYAVDRRWLSELPQSYTHPRTGEVTLGAPQVRVTAKGLAELHKRLGGTSPVQIPAASTVAAIDGGVR